MRKGKVGRFLAASVVLTVLWATPAYAEYVSTSGPTPYCTLEGWGTYRSGNEIYGSGEVSCSSFPYSTGAIELNIRVQRERWWGWETMNSTAATGSNPSGFAIYRQVYYNCSGTGTHNFRVEVHSKKTLQTPFNTFLYPDPLENQSC